MAKLVGAIGLVLAGLLAPTDPLPLPIELRWVGAYLLFVLLPGWLLVELLLPRLALGRGDWLERALLTLAAGYSLAILLGLVLHTLFRPVAPWQIAAGGGLLVLGLAIRSPYAHTAAIALAKAGSVGAGSGAMASGATGSGATGSGAVNRAPTRTAPVGARFTASLRGGALPVLLIVAVAGVLRLADLGWSEFQGDEARVVLRAMAALQGADGALAAHRKVPGEILLTYVFAGSLGQIVEGVARLPFALAGVGAVLAFYGLARKLVGEPAALAAGLLLAVNGYFVAFGRILQYDSLAFFLGISGLLCCWRFGRGCAPDEHDAAGVDGATAGDSPVAWAALGALLLSGAALVALGAVFLLPPAIVLAWPGLLKHRRSWRVLLAWSWPIVPGLLAAWLVLGASDSSEGPSGIMSYLGPRLGGERPYWHGLDLLLSADHYLSTPYLAVTLTGGVVAVGLGLLGAVRGMRGRAVTIRLALAIVLAALTWDRPRAALALGAVLLLLLALQGLRALPGRLGMRVALLWAAGPLFVHLFLIRVPGTHWREAFPGLIMALAALIAPALARRWSGLPLGGLLALLVVGAGHYSWVTLVQRVPEYQLSYPADRHPLDWSSQDGRGIGGVFGAVHHHGWKALGVLDAEGRLPGSFATNESPAIAAWYLRRAQGCEGTLTYVFRVPRAPQDRNLAGPVLLPAGYQARGTVRVNGRATISIQMSPASTARIGDVRADDYEARFDRDRASAWRPVAELYRADLGAATARRDCVVGAGITTFR